MADTDDAPLDALVIGAGPAGLTAATYLARFRRRLRVIDAGTSRARWIPTSHNCPGFPFGVEGPRLLDRLRAQAESFGVEVQGGRITALRRDDEGVFTAEAGDGRRWRARHVLLATGIVDRMPHLHELEQAIGCGAVRLCAVCDAYEARDGRLAVYGPLATALTHAEFLRTFSSDVAVLPSDAAAPDAQAHARAEAARLELLPKPAAMRLDGETLCVRFADGHERRFDSVYAALGGDAQSALATALGARTDDNGELEVDAHQQTSVDGLYAIGDVVSALNQISVAVGHAALAATAVHNRLPRNWRG
ncbi:MAG TPA: NAD(P)/FAD-dependent oxidoreductase [Lysobacter sp.]|nr:NAD(P)/FAD-dependent oxidoreductase [Lysobacter sp.]